MNGGYPFDPSTVLRGPNSDGFPVSCVVIRGGTSRGLFFHESDLPVDVAERDRVIMAAMGAPDPRQVDGLGGGDSLLSKVCIVSKSFRSDADVECEFANIAPGELRPTYGTNCGNLLAGAALFAIDEGLARSATGRRAVRIFNRNSSSLTSARIAAPEPDLGDFCHRSGMNNTGTAIHLDFHDPVGTVQDKLLPTGNARDLIELPGGGEAEVTIVDAGAMYVFVKAENLELTALETRQEMEASPDKMRDLEFIRGSAAKLLGIVDDVADAVRISPDVPKLAFVASAAAIPIDGDSTIVDAQPIDLVSRIISSQRFHNAYAVTAAVATAAAASVQGSIVHGAIGKTIGMGMQDIRIGHPSGTMDCAVDVESRNGEPAIRAVRITRTARRIMEGTVFIPGVPIIAAADAVRKKHS